MSLRKFAAPRCRVIRGLLALVFLTLTTRFCLGQDLPAELAFLKAAPLKPYNTTYEPWAYVQMPPGNDGANGAGKMVGGQHWQSPIIVAGGKDPDVSLAITKPIFLSNGWTVVKEFAKGTNIFNALGERRRGGMGIFVGRRY